MATHGSWRVLNASVETAPQLLVRTHFHSSGYEIELTDFSHVWRESLAKQEIIRRASEAGSSIDPSQDDEQFRIFLSKIESTLDGDNGTSLSLHAANNDGAVLSVYLSAKLPHPLPQFAWDLELELLSRQATERLLVTPLLQQNSRLTQQIDQLVAELHDKDRVISKICDRLETSGNDLTTVFPGVSNIKTSRKKGQREQLAKHVKGLADFNEFAWKAQHASGGNDGEIESSHINQVLANVPISSFEPFAVDKNWWQKLSRASQNKRNLHNAVGRSSASQRNHSSQRLGAPESEQDDDFQTQNTPPHLKLPNAPEKHSSQVRKSVSAAASPVVEQQPATIEDGDSETEDEEDDLDAAPHKSAPARLSPPRLSQPTRTSTSPRKLGVVGGPSTDNRSPSVEVAAPAETPSEVKPRSKLGKIGGKAKAAEVTTPDHQDADEEDDLDASVKAKPTKVGVIGGKRATPQTVVSGEKGVKEDTPIDGPADEERRSARTVTKTGSPAPREDSQERADRKRNQLKRQLEEKAKVPAKKKRKF